MATTYLELTNRVLRRLNEVELTSVNFLTARGVHVAVKDAVLDTVRKIYNKGYKWPFNSGTATQALSVGTEEYSWPASFESVEWNSFQIQKDTALNINNKRLIPITREEWYRYYRDLDFDADASVGRNVPEFVFETATGGWGVSPSPNQAYSVKFKYWTNPTEPSAHGDTTNIPTEFDYVITNGALYHMYLFMDNPDRTQLAEGAFRDGMNDMYNRYFGENHQHAHSPRMTSWPTTSNR